MLRRTLAPPGISTRNIDLPFLIGLLLTIAFATAAVLVFRVWDWDFHCYLNAGELVRTGRSPYSHELGTDYQYPPFVAHVFATGLGMLRPAAIFVLYQTVQVALLACAFCLVRVLALRAGASRQSAALIACLLCVVNFPILYNLKQQQVNLLMLDASLFAMLFPARSIVAGLALGIATQLKLYPAMLLAPLVLFGYFRLALWWAVGMLVPLAFEGVRLDWVRFFQLLPNLTTGEGVLNNSVASLIERGLAAAGYSSAIIVRLGAAVIGLTAAAVVARRTWLRFRAPGRDERRRLRSCAEWLALALFLSPIAWDHQFIFTLPLLTLLIVERSLPLLVAAAAALILLLPRTPVYPWTHHFLAGATLLFIASGRSKTSG